MVGNIRFFLVLMLPLWGAAWRAPAGCLAMAASW
jgi:hypothetical protein